MLDPKSRHNHMLSITGCHSQGTSGAELGKSTGALHPISTNCTLKISDSGPKSCWTYGHGLFKIQIG